MSVKEPKLVKDTPFVLTNENYYTTEADNAFMSVSQYKGFKKCEAAAMARLRGEYDWPKSDALIEGSYVHSWLDGTKEKFMEENPEIFSSRGASKGQLKAAYKVADDMIAALENDPMCMFALDGEKEVFMTGELFGVPWKIKIDVYNFVNKRFADLKTVKDIHERYWIEGKGWGCFVEAYGYVTQLAVYSEIERQHRGGEEWFDSYIVAISKQDPPDKAIIMVDQESMMEELQEIEKNLERIRGVKSGLVEPKPCDKCAYCRSKKKVTAVTHYLDLIDR